MKDKGYTLIEVMAVVAIVAVALTVGMMSVSTVFALSARACANNIAAALGKEKVSAMTRAGEVYMRLYKGEGGIFVDMYEDDAPVERGVKVGKASVSVTVCSESNPGGTPLDSRGVVIAFNRGDGSLKRIGEAWAMYDESAAPPFPGDHYTKIVVSAQGASRSIVFWPQTGKFAVAR